MIAITLRCALTSGMMLLPSLALADNCEALRAQIEAKIAASGVTQFSVTVADASGIPGGGQVVGSCAQGAKKIIYTRAATRQTPPAASVPVPVSVSASAPARKTKPRTMLTECKNGTVSADGNCR
jgi:hypothetical protein